MALSGFARAVTRAAAGWRVDEASQKLNRRTRVPAVRSYRPFPSSSTFRISVLAAPRHPYTSRHTARPRLAHLSCAQHGQTVGQKADITLRSCVMTLALERGAHSGRDRNASDAGAGDRTNCRSDCAGYFATQGIFVVPARRHRKGATAYSNRRS